MTEYAIIPVVLEHVEAIEEEGISLSLIFAIVMIKCHMMLHCKQFHFSPDLFGGGDNVTV